VMGRFDPTAPDARTELAGWLAQPHMAGIRMTFHKPKWAAWLDDGAIDWFWADCERLGIPLMLLIPGRLDAVASLARRHPALTLVVDHMGVHSNFRDAQCEPDIAALLRLAVYPNVCVKTSAVPCYSTQPYPFGNFNAYLERIYQGFGPRRMFWGSDVSRLPCTWREAVDHFLHELDFLPEADKPWVMGRALSRVLRWPQPQGAS
jgi:predicted TIM-barrel fold metal-dependent hydrolase